MMSRQWPIDEAVDELTSLGLMTECRRVGSHRIQGTTVVESIKLSITIQLPDFPPALPIITIDNPEVLGRIAHVGATGFICYLQSNGLSIRFWDLKEVIIGSLETALDVVRKGLRKENTLDFREEAVAEWASAGALLGVDFFGEELERPAIFPVTGERSGQRLAIGLSDSDRHGGSSQSPGIHGQALVLPLEPGFGLNEFDPRQLLDLGSLRRTLAEHLSADNYRIMTKMLGKQNDIRYLLIGVPQLAGDHALLGVCIGTPSALLAPKVLPGVFLYPFTVVRRDRAYLLARAGASTTISSRSALVLGCGSLGGHVASALSRTGIGRLTLVDPEDLKEINIYRHVLGQRSVGQPKARELATLLKDDVPYLEVEPLVAQVQSILSGRPSLCNEHDVVVNTTGDISLSRWLNHRVHHASSARLVHSWLEPLGIGGNAIIDGRKRR